MGRRSNKRATRRRPANVIFARA